MSTQENDKYANAAEQAQAQFESIKEMVEVYQKGDDTEAAIETIYEDALDIEVRGDWTDVSHWNNAHRDLAYPVEYRITLCTGGPAVRIIGKLDEDCEPKTAKLEMQDWDIPWKEYTPWHGPAFKNTTTVEEILLAYARCFYFGQ